MQVITTKAALRAARREAGRTGGSIALVPTMGFLHDGHLSLVEQARANHDVVFVSVFVNPTQFGPNEDFDAYPRDLDRDLALLEAAGVDVVFAPDAAEMYPRPQEAFVVVDGPLTTGLCGASRPGHFRGVATVVTKLFNLVQPDVAYFGQKDAQQVAVLRRMVADLDQPVDIRTCPIRREADGLAMSSRNTFLTPAERAEAPVLQRALADARERIEAGERSAAAITAGIREMIDAVDGTDIDYVQVVDADTLEPLETLQGRVLIALAVRLGIPRLIDNTIVEIH